MTFAGSGGTGGYAGDGYAATGALLDGPQSVAVDKNGNAYIVDYYNYRIRKVKTNGEIVTFAGNGGNGLQIGTYATSATMDPTGVAADSKGNVYVSEAVHGAVCKISPVGIITLYAGNGSYGYSGNGGPATAAMLTAPMGLAVDKNDNLYIADAGNHSIRKVDTFGVISTVAGCDTEGYWGDNGSALLARLDSPFAVAIDKQGDLYIADRSNNVIRFVDNTGTIYTIAGNGMRGYSGDGAEAISGELAYPCGVAVDTNDFIYISDSYNNVIRKVDTLGIITTFAGNGYPGFGGDLGAPQGANLFHPYGICTDTLGNIFIADANNQRVRKVFVAVTFGVNSLAGASAISAYPNPIGNEVNVTGLIKSDKVCIYDLAGKPVSNSWTVQNDGLQSFQIGDLADGMYLLQVSDNAGNLKASVKVVK